jgi:hypothetical protein
MPQDTREKYRLDYRNVVIFRNSFVLMKKLLLLLLCISFAGYSQPVKLSEEATISVITCGPWQGELYSAFGHSAFRVYDPAQDIDDAYNYGVFNFDQPNFYLNFTRGFMYYQLGVYDYNRFRDVYIYHNRYIHEQVLNLTQEQKQKMYDFLQWNALPENENYRYNYFYDNCATKMPGVLRLTFGDSVVFDGSYIKTDYSIRELTDLYLENQPWGDLGIDIGLGSQIDKKATPYEYMFLPDYVESGLDHATIKQNGVSVPLVKEKRIVYEERPEDAPKGLPHPLYIFSFIALIAGILTYRDWKKQKLSTWLDAIIFIVTGLVGVMLTFLWFGTDHNSAYNYNLLWALPTNLLVPIAFIRQPAWLKKYFLVVAVIAVLTLLLWPVLPQKLNIALVPIVITIALRGFIQYKLRNAS